MEPYVGQIQPFGFSFPPRGWAFCDGTQLPIAQYTALFSLLGTTFGGDGRVTFALPDLRGRYIRHVGTGPGLDHVSWGERGGDYELTITTSHMPSHTHNYTPQASSSGPDQDDPANHYPATGTFYHETADEVMGSSTTAATGGGQPINSLNPFLGIYVSIALTGIYPSRN